MNSVYRLMALRVCNAFITTSNEAALVVTDMIPPDLLENEMIVRYHRGRMEGHTERKDAARSESHDLWQRRCDEFSKGR